MTVNLVTMTNFLSFHKFISYFFKNIKFGQVLDFKVIRDHTVILYLTGSHTGTNIHNKYEEVVRLYDVSEKISYIVTDNASNMKSAFAVTFPIGEPEDPSEDEAVWLECEDDSVDGIVTTRISCFAHSLQLTVGDGLKESKAVAGALSRAVSVSSTLHRSTAYKVCYVTCKNEQPVH